MAFVTRKPPTKVTQREGNILRRSQSKALAADEKKYQIYEQECLAVVWAAELFKKYVRNTKTKVLTDCAALQWLKTRTAGARVMRWIMDGRAHRRNLDSRLDNSGRG